MTTPTQTQTPPLVATPLVAPVAEIRTKLDAVQREATWLRRLLRLAMRREQQSVAQGEPRELVSA
jgi:hypothetical protein